MKYKENEPIEEVTTTDSSVKETSINIAEKEDLISIIRKTIDLRIKIIEDSLEDLKNTLMQLEDLYNEGDN